MHAMSGEQSRVLTDKNMNNFSPARFISTSRERESSAPSSTELMSLSITRRLVRLVRWYSQAVETTWR